MNKIWLEYKQQSDMNIWRRAANVQLCRKHEQHHLFLQEISRDSLIR